MGGFGTIHNPSVLQRVSRCRRFRFHQMAALTGTAARTFVARRGPVLSRRRLWQRCRDRRGLETAPAVRSGDSAHAVSGKVRSRLCQRYLPGPSLEVHPADAFVLCRGGTPLVDGKLGQPSAARGLGEPARTSRGIDRPDRLSRTPTSNPGGLWFCLESKRPSRGVVGRPASATAGDGPGRDRHQGTGFPTAP